MKVTMKDYILSKLNDIIVLEEPDIPKGRVGVCDDFLPPEVFAELRDRMAETEKTKPVKDWKVDEPYTIPSRMSPIGKIRLSDGVTGVVQVGKTTHTLVEFTDTEVIPISKIGMPTLKGQGAEFNHPSKVALEFQKAWNSTDVISAYFDKLGATDNKIKEYCTISRVHSYAPGWWYRNHLDVPLKIFTIVVYMFPEEPNNFLKYPLGTEIHSGEHNSYYGHVEWKPNRAIMFHVSNHPWHAFNVPKQMNQHRWVLMMNVIQNDSFFSTHL
jgi:hypothetical protein